MRRLLSSALLVVLITTTGLAQTTLDYSVLSQPLYASKLNLTDQQRAEVARILDQRVADLVGAAEGDREKILADSNDRLAQVLTEEQRQTLQSSLQSGKLQFNFSQQKWGTVLEWVAKQAGLSLVMDAEPTGLFTYTDTNEYTPTEAIDLLNSVLLSKNFTLIRREKMLVLADTSDGIPYDIVPQITVEELAQRGRFEIVTVEFPLGARPVDTVVEQVTPLIGTHGQVTPLGAAKKLLVTEAAGKLQAINVLIASIPEPAKPTPPPASKPPEPIFATYQAPGLDPSATIETLQALFPAAQLRFDPNAQEIHANAIPTMQSAIEASIEKMVANVSGDNQPRLRAYPVDKDQIDEIVRQISLVHPKINVIGDPTNSRLLVVANEKEQADLQATLKEIGVESPDEQDVSVRVEVYPLDDQAIEPLNTLLKEVIPRALVLSNAGRLVVRGSDSEQVLAKSTIDQFLEDSAREPRLVFYPLQKPLDDAVLASLSGLVPNATINQLAEENRLSVVAMPKDHELIAKTLTEIEQIPATDQNRSLRLYPVSEKQKSRLAAISSELGALTGTMKLVMDASPNELAAWGTEEQHVAFEQLLGQLKSQEKPMSLEAKQLPVTVRDASTLLALMQERFPEVPIILNAASDALYVWAEDEVFDAIRMEHQKLAASMPEKSELTLEVYSLETGNASALLSTIQTLTPTATISLDAEGTRLIVMASKKDHQQIAETIDKLVEKDTTATPVLISYALEKASADAVVTLLSSIQPDWNIVADPRSNRVLASAPLREQPRIEAMIQQLDAEPDQANETIVESYPFRTLDPSTVVAMLQSLFPQMQLTVDAANRQIVASGTGLDQQKLLAAIERVDGRGLHKETKVAAYPLGNATAEQVTNVLMQLVPSAVISASPEANRVFVWADEDSHQAIAQAIEEFTAQRPEEARTLKTYRLPRELADSAVSILQPMVQTASLTMDSSGNSLIVWGTEGQQQSIADAIETLLENHSARADQVLKLHRSTPEALLIARPVLSELVPEVQIVDTSSSDHLVVWGKEQDQVRIADVLKNIEQEVSQDWSDQEARFYAIDKISVSTIQTILSEQVPQSRLLESNENHVLMLASADQHQQIADILEQLRTAMRSQDVVVLRKHQVRRDLISQITEFLTSSLPQAKLVATDGTDSISVWASEQEQAEIEEWIKQFESELDEPAQRMVRVYPIDLKRMTVTALLNALDSETSEGLTLQPNTETNSLVARGTEIQHERLKSAIETIVEQLPESMQSITRVYRFHNGTPTSAATVLAAMMPDARIAADEGASVLVVSATADQHQSIAEVVEQIEATEPTANQTTRVYRFDRATAATVRDAFTMLAPDARIAFDSGSNVVIATASEQEHAVLSDAATQLEGRPKGSLVRVYPIDRQKMTTQTLVAALDDALKNALVIQESQGSNSLIVRGSAEDHAQLQQAIDAIVDKLPEATDTLLTKVYAMKLADPAMVATALSSLTPQATIAPDSNSGSLIVTATSEDHQQIAAVIDQLDVPSGQAPVMRAYPIREGDAGAIYRSVSSAFAGNPDFVISFQDINKTVYVIATPRNHAVFAELLESLDTPPPVRPPRQPRLYPLANLNATDAAATVRALTDGQFPPPDIRPNLETNSLVVVANDNLHALIAEALEKLDGDERQLEVFQLLSADPFVVEAAVSELFAELPEMTAPSISTDYGTNKLFVRATETQLEQIRRLLEKLGEPTGDSQYPLGTGNSRRIVFPGGTREVLEQIETIWPRIRRNKIQVVTPSSNTIQPVVPGIDRGMKPDDAGESGTEEGTSPLSGDDAASYQGSKRREMQLVLTQDTTRAPAPDNVSADDKSPQQSLETAPILVFPGSDNITISSDDQEALNLLESLLRAMADSQAGLGGSSNFAVFLLRNSGAENMELLLKELIDELPFQRGGLGEAVVVADDRLNALIVHGSARTRELVGELLEVLDTQDIPDPLQAFRPEMIRLQHTQAERVMAILENVYKSQLTSGGGRKPITIPEGVDSTVASVLQQINAATSGPLLTLDVDQTSNALVVRAPSELREEIRSFVEELDNQAMTQSNRRVRVIRLKQSKSDLMQSVLQQFINGQ